jgi:hypothetical protein
MPAFHGLTSARQNPIVARPAIGAHAQRPAAAEGAGKRRRRRRGIPVTGAQPPRRDQGRGVAGGGGELGRGATSGRCSTSGTEMRVSEGGRRHGRARRRREMALRACRGGAAHQERGACRGWTRRGEAAATMTEEEERRFGGKRLSADLEGDGAYIEPPTFCHGCVLRPETKDPLLSRVASRPVTKGAFRAGCPEGEFSSFSPWWCYQS